MPAEPLIGEISMAAFNFAPVGYAACDGSTLTINSYQALYALIGTTFGGNGTTTFGLPDLRGRIPMGQGTGTGLTARTIGQKIGAESVTLSTANLPSHTHSLVAVTDAGTTSVPTGAYLANTGTLDKEFKTTGTTTNMNAGAIGSTGSGTAVSVMQPGIVLNFYIATEGIFPSRP